jgi:GTP-binding protein
MIPCDCDDIKKEYNILLSELERYNPELLDKDRVLAITKCDMLDEQMKNEMKNLLPENIESVFISSVTGENIQQLKDILWRVLNK